MLNIQFSVQGDANDKLVEIQAKGVVAALYAIYGDAVLPLNLNARALSVADAKRELRKVIEDTAAAHADAGGEPDAAEAFGGTRTPSNSEPASEEPDAASAFGANIYGNTDKGGVGPDGMISTVARDSAGIPWDERIHSSTKGTNKDGTWSRRRNTPDATFDAVMAELKGANTQRTMEAATALVPPPPTAPSVPAPPPVPSAPSATPAPPASLTAPAGGDGLIDPDSPTAFPDIMKVVTKAQAAGKIDTGGVSNLLSSLGVEPPSVATLLKQKHHIPAFQALLADHVAMQG